MIGQSGHLRLRTLGLNTFTFQNPSRLFHAENIQLSLIKYELIISRTRNLQTVTLMHQFLEMGPVPTRVWVFRLPHHYQDFSFMLKNRCECHRGKIAVTQDGLSELLDTMAKVQMREIRLQRLILHLGSVVGSSTQRIEAMERMEHVNPTINPTRIEYLRDGVGSLNAGLSAKVIEVFLLCIRKSEVTPWKRC